MGHGHMVNCSSMRGSISPAAAARSLLLLHLFTRRGSSTALHRHTAAFAQGGVAAPPQRVAVIGGGFAGLAVSWNLLAAAHDAGRPMQLQLFDAFGLGAGGSGAAAGLVHPYTPRGKMLWRGLEAFQEAAALLEAAGAAAAQGFTDPAGQPAVIMRQPFAWRHGVLRPARSAKQARDIARSLRANPAAAAATGAEAITDAAALATLVPGLQPDQLLPAEQLAGTPPLATHPALERRRDQPQQEQVAEQAGGLPGLGLMVHAAATIHPASYMQALWLACQQEVHAAGTGSAARLTQQAVPSLRHLQVTEGPFDAIVVAAGAAMESIEELRGLMPLRLCHGYSLDMRPISSGDRENKSSSSSSLSSAAGGFCDGYPAGAPSLLGSPYIAAHGVSSLVVGATKRHGLTAAEAFQQCSTPVVTDAFEAATAVDALVPAACVLWPPLRGWQVKTVRAGVRALPARGSDESIPYAGRLTPQEQLPSCWVIGGLGARGLVYHAWLGKLVAAAMASGSDSGLPPELLRWKTASGRR